MSTIFFFSLRYQELALNDSPPGSLLVVIVSENSPADLSDHGIDKIFLNKNVATRIKMDGRAFLSLLQITLKNNPSKREVLIF